MSVPTQPRYEIFVSCLFHVHASATFCVQVRTHASFLVINLIEGITTSPTQTSAFSVQSRPKTSAQSCQVTKFWAFFSLATKRAITPCIFSCTDLGAMHVGVVTQELLRFSTHVHCHSLVWGTDAFAGLALSDDLGRTTAASHYTNKHYTMSNDRGTLSSIRGLWIAHENNIIRLAEPCRSGTIP